MSSLLWYAGELDSLRQAASGMPTEQDKQHKLDAIRVENATLQEKLQYLTFECKKKEEAMNMLTSTHNLEGLSASIF